MDLAFDSFDKTDNFQFVKTIDPCNHYLVIDGKVTNDCRYVYFDLYDINYTDINSSSNVDSLNDLINTYYDSAIDFWLHETDSQEQAAQFLAEMIAEQDWNIEPLKTVRADYEDLLTDDDFFDDSKVRKYAAATLKNLAINQPQQNY